LLASARLGFAVANPEGRADVELVRHFGACLAAHQPVETPRQLTLLGFGKALAQPGCKGQAQNAVTEELETLIAVAARTRWRQGAGMRQRPLQQGRVAKAVADALLQRSIELALTVGGHRCEAQIIGWPKRNRGRVRRSIE